MGKWHQHRVGKAAPAGISHRLVSVPEMGKWDTRQPAFCILPEAVGGNAEGRGNAPPLSLLGLANLQRGSSSAPSLGIWEPGHTGLPSPIPAAGCGVRDVQIIEN